MTWSEGPVAIDPTPDIDRIESRSAAVPPCTTGAIRFRSVHGEVAGNETT
jgi:hypothetical protein